MRLVASGGFNPFGRICGGTHGQVLDPIQSSMSRLCTRVSFMVNATKKLIPATADA
jgi:hypothetical protein